MSEHFDREMFERAFAEICGGCRRRCACGRVFFDTANRWDWEDGELEELENDPNATGVPHMISTMFLEGRIVVMDCNCWVERAKAITKWLDENGPGICKWFNLRKEEALSNARALPDVKS